MAVVQVAEHVRVPTARQWELSTIWGARAKAWTTPPGIHRDQPSADDRLERDGRPMDRRTTSMTSSV